jgi:hypothetical protein
MSAPSIKLVHTSLCYTLLKQARINFEQTPKPANLHYLADHASSEELQELYQWNPGDVAIFALERNNARMLRNVRECAYGTMHQRISFSEFIRDFRSLPSGMCPPERDHHLVGAELSFRGPSNQELSALLDFCADDRFIKPGLATAVAIRVQLPMAEDVALCRAMDSTLDNASKDCWPPAPSRLAAYFAALLTSGHSSLDVETLAYERGEQVHAYCHAARMLFQVSKKAGPLQNDRRPTPPGIATGDRTMRIGTVFLPTGKRPPLRPRTVS